MGHKSPHPIGLNEVNWLRKRKLREEIQHYESSEKIAAAPGRKRIELRRLVGKVSRNVAVEIV